MRASALPAQSFPESKRAATSQDKGECQKMTLFMTWAQGRVEMSPVALLPIRPFPLERRPHTTGP